MIISPRSRVVSSVAAAGLCLFAIGCGSGGDKPAAPSADDGTKKKGAGSATEDAGTKKNGTKPATEDVGATAQKPPAGTKPATEDAGAPTQKPPAGTKPATEDAGATAQNPPALKTTDKVGEFTYFYMPG